MGLVCLVVISYYRLRYTFLFSLLSLHIFFSLFHLLYFRYFATHFFFTFPRFLLSLHIFFHFSTFSLHIFLFTFPRFRYTFFSLFPIPRPGFPFGEFSVLASSTTTTTMTTTNQEKNR